MKKSYLVLRKAVDKIGVKKLAAELKCSHSLIYKWCQDKSVAPGGVTASGAANPLDRLRKVYDLSQDLDIVQHMCQAADGYFVENETFSRKQCDSTVLKNIQAFIKDFSETLDVISESYNNEKRITLSEAKRIRKEWEDLKRTGEGFVRACELGRFDKRKKGDAS